MELMARGWESKDVESQQELTMLESRRRQGPQKTAGDHQRDSLMMTRTRIMNDLGRATHPRHRAQLEAALAHLDEQLKRVLP
jgi:hypothetical protein